MAVEYLNACGFRASSAGLGDFVVASALTGYYTPAQCANPAVANGQTYYYRAESDDLTEHEEGLGTYTTGTVTLARTTVYSSSNAGAKVNFTAAPRVRITIFDQGLGFLTDLTAAQATALLNAMVGDSGAGGTKGLVPAPGVGDAAALKFLGSNGGFSVPGRSRWPLNMSLAASVAANALTIALKGADGNDPSASNPVVIPFRSATAASGVVTDRVVTSAMSLVISSGSTLGTANGTPMNLWVVAFDDAGTVRLGVIHCLSSLDVYPLQQFDIASSTAEGGAGAADSAHTFYTGTAVTSKAYTVLGYVYFAAGQATAGTWATGPTRIENVGPSVPLPGQRVQRVIGRDSAVASGTTTLPSDDTIPQNTEGTEFITKAITPTNTANLLDLRIKMNMGSSIDSATMAIALFQDSTADALAVATDQAAATFFKTIPLDHTMRAGTVSSTTFKVRAGTQSAGTFTFNGIGGTNRRYGGVYYSSINIEEIQT
jgi:hypothetical protein